MKLKRVLFNSVLVLFMVFVSGCSAVVAAPKSDYVPGPKIISDEPYFYQKPSPEGDGLVGEIGRKITYENGESEKKPYYEVYRFGNCYLTIHLGYPTLPPTMACEGGPNRP